MKLVTVGGVLHTPLAVPFVFEIVAAVTVTPELPEGELIVNDAGDEVCPPLETLMDTVPGEAIRLASTEALNWVELTKVVGRLEAFHSTCASETKFVPNTVSVNAPLPAVIDDGLRLVMVGFKTVAGVIVKTSEFDVPEPACDVICTGPAEPGTGVVSVMFCGPM